MRREFSSKVKIAAWQRAKGHCEACTCRLMAGNIIYDHDNPDGLTGEPTLANCRVLCKSCHKPKTGDDITKIARAKRRERAAAGVRRPRTITRWRRFDGTIVIAPKER